MRTVYTWRLNKGFCLKFSEDDPDKKKKTLEEGWKAHVREPCDNIKDEDNSSTANNQNCC